MYFIPARIKQAFQDESGQLLVYILAAVVVASVVTFGAAYRSLVGIRKAGISTQSSESLYAAESCAESALALSDTELSSLIGNTTGLDLDNDSSYDCSYEISTDGNSTALAPFLIAKDEVREINLSGYTGSAVRLYWNLVSNSSEDAILSVKGITKSGATYGVNSWLYDGDSNNDCGVYVTTGFSAVGAGNGTYNHSAVITLPANIAFLRIKSLCSSTTVLLDSNGTVNNIPAQGFVITASGFIGDTIRKVQVVRGHPQLPAIFDYALFSKSATAPLSK